MFMLCSKSQALTSLYYTLFESFTLANQTTLIRLTLSVHIIKQYGTVSVEIWAVLAPTTENAVFKNYLRNILHNENHLYVIVLA